MILCEWNHCKIHTFLIGTEFSGSLQYFALNKLVIIVVVVIAVVVVVVVVVVVGVVVLGIVVEVIMDAGVVLEDASVVPVFVTVLQSQAWTSAKGSFSSNVKSMGPSVSKSVVNITGGIGGNVDICGGGIEPKKYDFAIKAHVNNICN